MGKAEKGTPKDLANKMKAKGLQKLRWYCQMCQKQCRDENGFKCHTMSESHQRQLLLFAEDPDKFLDTFSEEFLEGYLSLLSRRFGTKRVHANNVYQEYIQDREHIHMNATQWETLTDFVKWLGREGRCIVDETEKGWYVAYVDRDPETLRRQEQAKRREKFEKDEEERFQEFINKQIELGKSKVCEEKTYSELQRDEGETITLNMKLSGVKHASKRVEKAGNILASTSKAKPESKKEIDRQREARKRSALADIMEEEIRGKKIKEEVRKQQEIGGNKQETWRNKQGIGGKYDKKQEIWENKQKIGGYKQESGGNKQETWRNKQVKGDNKQERPGNSDPPWLTQNIIVKVITKDLGSKFYKQKGLVKDVLDNYIGVIKLLDCGTKMKLDQSHLETVIPSPGRKVLILNGKYKGEDAILKSIQEESFSATLELKDGYIVKNIPYEHFSKLYVS